MPFLPHSKLKASAHVETNVIQLIYLSCSTEHDNNQYIFKVYALD